MSKARELANLGNVYSDGALSNRNVIINGDFSVSQRGDYATSATVPSDNGYYLDRWKDWGGVARTMQKLTASINGVTQNTLKYICTAGASETYMGARQFIEAINLQDGQQYTISCMMRTNNANARIRTYEFNGTSGVNSDACPSDGNWHKVTLTQTYSYSSGINPQIGFILYSATGTTVNIATNDYIEVANFQCEVGDTATPFEHRSYGQELALCQRYYNKIVGDVLYTGIANGLSQTSSTGTFAMTFPQEMRVAPSLSQANLGMTDHTNYTSIVSGVNYGSVGKKSLRFGLIGTAVMAAYRPASVIAASAGGYLAFDAEL